MPEVFIVPLWPVRGMNLISKIKYLQKMISDSDGNEKLGSDAGEQMLCHEDLQKKYTILN